MSTITVLFDMLNVTAVQYDEVIKGLQAAGAGNPEGRLYHFASPKEEGWLVVDVWELMNCLTSSPKLSSP